MTKAAQVFGGRERAESWMLKPVLFLDRRRPIDLMQTEEEAELVRAYLVRIDNCVFS